MKILMIKQFAINLFEVRDQLNPYYSYDDENDKICVMKSKSLEVSGSPELTKVRKSDNLNILN